MTCLSGSHSFQLLTCVLSGDHFTVFILCRRPARSRPFSMIDSAAVDELRNRMASCQSAESDRETFGDRSGNSQLHRAWHATAFGETTASVSWSRARDLDCAFAHIPALDAVAASASGSHGSRRCAKCRAQGTASRGSNGALEATGGRCWRPGAASRTGRAGAIRSRRRARRT